MKYTLPLIFVLTVIGCSESNERPTMPVDVFTKKTIVNQETQLGGELTTNAKRCIEERAQESTGENRYDIEKFDSAFNALISGDRAPFDAIEKDELERIKNMNVEFIDSVQTCAGISSFMQLLKYK